MHCVHSLRCLGCFTVLTRLCQPVVLLLCLSQPRNSALCTQPAVPGLLHSPYSSMPARGIAALPGYPRLETVPCTQPMMPGLLHSAYSSIPASDRPAGGGGNRAPAGLVSTCNVAGLVLGRSAVLRGAPAGAPRGAGAPGRAMPAGECCVRDSFQPEKPPAERIRGREELVKSRVAGRASDGGARIHLHTHTHTHTVSMVPHRRCCPQHASALMLRLSTCVTCNALLHWHFWQSPYVRLRYVMWGQPIRTAILRPHLAFFAASVCPIHGDCGLKGLPVNTSCMTREHASGSSTTCCMSN